MDIDSVYLQFPSNTDCVVYLEQLLWGGKPTCPFCGRKNSTPIKTENRHHCNVCNLAFSVTARTIFHGTRLPLQKWFLSIGLMMGVDRDPTARELAALIGVDKNTANALLKKIKVARIQEFALLSQ